MGLRAAVDPVADAETVETELMLADLESLDRQRAPVSQARRHQGQGRDDCPANDGKGAGAAAVKANTVPGPPARPRGAEDLKILRGLIG